MRFKYNNHKMGENISGVGEDINEFDTDDQDTNVQEVQLRTLNQTVIDDEANKGEGERCEEDTSDNKPANQL